MHENIPAPGFAGSFDYDDGVGQCRPTDPGLPAGMLSW
jgi:hypothetical protein